MGTSAAREFDFPAFDWEEPAGRPAAVARRRARRPHARSRARLIRRRQTDLRQDVALAVGIAVLGLTLTAGLAVVVLLSIPVAGALLGSIVLERRLRQRRAER